VEMNPVLFFTFKINTIGNPNVGSGKLDGDGIPADFFTDKDVRKGFAYSLDYGRYIKDSRRGQGLQATGCIPNVLPGHNPKQPAYGFDAEKAKEHFKKAWGGKVWDKGFVFTLLYNSGNLERETLAQIVKRSVEALNPKFRIDVRPVEWPSFLDQSNSSKLPIFMLGWAADFPDPHNFAFELMHSKGNYPKIQHYASAEADKLIEQAIAETDIAKRKPLYLKLQQLEHEDVPHLVVVDGVRYRTERDWVHGYVHNAIFPDSPYGSYFYDLWKAPASAAGKGTR
jgi:peptide/nickel transport system substrate-binding protein